MKFTINAKQIKNAVRIVFQDIKKEQFEKGEKGLFILALKNFKKEDGLYKSDELRNKIGFIRNIIRVARQNEIENLEINFTDLESDVEFTVQNLLMANYEFDKFKTKKKDEYLGVQSVNFTDVVNEKEFKAGMENGVLIGTEVNKARDLSNSPANIINPITLADYVNDNLKNIANTKLSILNKKDLEKIKAGGILAVAAGSNHEPRLISMEYWGADKKVKPIIFVGKGVTHDNGGINLKPSSGGYLEEMHLDMSGASAVIHAFMALAKMKVKKNIIAIVPAVENSISGECYRPGDIMTMLNGKTVEVLNTDAEGRIILADALTYTQEKFDSEIIVNVATLTGAALIALGTSANCLMGNDQNLVKEMLEIGNEKTGDFLWELPLWDEFKKAVKNKRADYGNIPETSSRYGGSINAGMFLKEFINKGQKWAHIDMAPRMTSTASDNLASGAMGETVRLFVEMGRK